MPTVRKSVIVPQAAESMFALVEDVERYPEFLPWCAGTHVYERTEHVIRARLDIAYHGLRTHVATRNEKEAPHRMTLELVDGPFHHFHGEWRFTPLGAAGCRAELTLDYQLASAALQLLLGRVFEHVADTLVERFVARAEALHAPPGAG
jgi:ribosome-associated toxin RatA of RatAB toxin-antitoxin module